MVTYFRLDQPASENLLADVPEGGPPTRILLPCPVFPDHFEGSIRTGNLVLRVKHNQRDQMIIWSRISGCVIHTRLVEEFQRCGFNGFRLRPATVHFRDGFESTEYRELIATGWAGLARPESGIHLIESCPSCHWKKYSRLRRAEGLIDWAQWTGEDFFIVWPIPKYALITERVASRLIQLDVKSFTLASMQELETWDFGFTVGRLSSYMPEDLAIKYGAPLGLE